MRLDTGVGAGEAQEKPKSDRQQACNGVGAGEAGKAKVRRQQRHELDKINEKSDVFFYSAPKGLHTQIALFIDLDN